MIRIPLKRGNKFGAVKQYGYDSRAEAKYGAELELRLRVGEFRDMRRQVTVPLVVNGVKVCSTRVDFVVTHLDGSEEWIEVKGFWTPEYRLKEKLFRALYPERRYTVVQV